ncbi:MAG: HEAT repeat domain-containing protein [Acidobacteriota bacterium]
MLHLLLIATLFYLGYRALRAAFGHPPTWVRNAPEMGLEPDSRGLSGYIGSYAVAVVRQEEFEITISWVDPGFTVKPAGVGTLILRGFDFTTGDSYLDSRVVLGGDARAAFALLDRKLRADLARLVPEYWIQIKGTRLEARVKSLDAVADALKQLTALADRLPHIHDSDIPKRLKERATGDDPVALRFQALRALREFYLHAPESAAAARILLDSPYSDLRIAATTILLRRTGEVQQEGIETILQTLLNTDIPESTRRQVLDLLIDESDRTAAAPVLKAWLATPIPEPELRRAAIRACARRVVLEPLLDLVVEGADEHLLLIESLSEIGDRAAQPRLLEELRHSSDRVRAAAASALIPLGDTSALAPLGEALAACGDPAARRRVAEAIESIQRRLGVAQAGEMSIVPLDSLEGSLSRADGPEGGEVSLDDGAPSAGST